MLLSCSKTKLRLVLCRNKYGEYFGITVAGYPEAHPDAIVSDAAEMDKIYWNDLHYLKEKVVTQQTSHGDARMLGAPTRAYTWVPVRLCLQQSFDQSCNDLGP